MQGIQQMFRQHAVDKQSSIDSWHSTSTNNSSSCNSSYTNGKVELVNELKPWNQDRVLDQLHEITVASSPKSVPNSKKQTAAQECNSLGNSFNSRWRRCSPDPNKMMMGRSPNVGDYNPRRILSTTPTRKASNSVSIERVGSPSLSGYPGVRRSSYDGRSSPAPGGYFPHDLNDIYEYKTDHQYFTHTGATNTSNSDKLVISSEAQRNSLFRNSNNFHSADENSTPKGRFDNSSFAKDLEMSISNGSVDSGNHTGLNSSNNSKERFSKNHHHHSIQEMIRHLSKKVHLWSRSRHDSISENEIVNDRRTSTPEPNIHLNSPPDNFRSRSKSLDVTSSRRVLDDCESTYKIYNKILKEGKHNRDDHCRAMR